MKPYIARASELRWHHNQEITQTGNRNDKSMVFIFNSQFAWSDIFSAGDTSSYS